MSREMGFGSPHREIARIDVAEVFPGNRHRHRRPRSCTRRVRQHGGRALAVAQIVDKELAGTFCLRHGRDVALWCLGGQRLRDALRETLGLCPVCLRYQRNQDMQALAAGSPDESLEPRLRQCITDFQWGLDDFGKAQRQVRIKIDHQLIRLADLRHRRTPAVKLDGTAVHRLAGNAPRPRVCLWHRASAKGQRARVLGKLTLGDIRTRVHDAIRTADVKATDDQVPRR